jgi:hypothetical protein
LFDFFEHIGTAKPDFFLSSAGTKSVGIKGHELGSVENRKGGHCTGEQKEYKVIQAVPAPPASFLPDFRTFLILLRMKNGPHFVSV